ncbi:unnamed protein product [Aureobasidium pullulans]|nr:unnamed protein product [Aureobasidium pullulans]
MAQQENLSRIPIRVDSKSTDRPRGHSLQKEPHASLSPSKPRHLRLNHKALSTIFESAVDESKDHERRARWSIRAVNQDHKEHDDEQIFDTKTFDQDGEQQQAQHESPESQTSSLNSQLEKSLTSTNPTSICDSQASDQSAKINDYKEAYLKYRLISLQSQKLSAASNLHVTLDKTQFLTNQLHVSTNAFNLLCSIIQQFSGSSATIKDLRERTTNQQATLSVETDNIRLAVRNLLKTNYTVIAECEVLRKEANTSNLSLFTAERLAVNRLLTTFSSSKVITVDRDEELECQQDTLTTFNDYVGSLVQNLDVQNDGLEKLIKDVNQQVRELETEMDEHVRDKKSLKNMLRDFFDLR